MNLIQEISAQCQTLPEDLQKTGVGFYLFFTSQVYAEAKYGRC